MSARLVVRPEALREIAEAAEWYEERARGLSVEFLRAVDVAVAAIRANPLQHAAVTPALRRALLRRFPYGLVFAVSDESTTIVALAHWRQHPRSWRDRR